MLDSASNRDMDEPLPESELDLPPPPPPRLRCLDALRGFDMFWIIGGRELFLALGAATQVAWIEWLAGEMFAHAEWHGFTLYDLIFPLFLFIAGAALPWSVEARLERGEARGRLFARTARRGLSLVILGVIYGGFLRHLDLEAARYPSVLGRIGLAWMLAAWICLWVRERGRLLFAAGALGLYWALMRFVPVPGFPAGTYSMEGNLASYLDRSLLPGKLYKDIHDPEGLLATLPAIATALLGALAGGWLKREGVGAARKLGGLIAASAICFGLGWAWDLAFPINKNLWTSSFVLWCAGWSFGLLAAFYLLVDVCRLSWVFLPFLVVGMNAITIYVGRRLIDFAHARDFLLGGTIDQFDGAWRAVAATAGTLLLELLVLGWMYKRRVFVRL